MEVADGDDGVVDGRSMLQDNGSEYRIKIGVGVYEQMRTNGGRHLIECTHSASTVGPNQRTTGGQACAG